ncbi:MAG: 50S ribosomal protein L29 [Gemmatimonadetes bacterium]|nr:50S ribosomal protein L29 [Gemmatimonadota bacterium]MXZ75137.1 50S ribosomal protein L29 [Gemmatimonadota bacterium]MYA77380.1 50S ribosomal protein L29 [Gemmatimonadota bacterium]MYG15264.1 50S ribosomal protein L29 [Gemmatimonadota bacterium]MYH19654.1 50S ribosomal protein L29 [Gemmatimonadota bacterium]
MKLYELRQLSETELRDRVTELREEIFNLNFQKATRQMADAKRISSSRREIARILTLLHEDELQIRSIQAAGDENREDGQDDPGEDA